MTGLNASLVRGAVTSPFRHAGRPGATLPTDRLTLPAAPAAPGPLAAYRRICHFPPTVSGPLPLTYPHVLGFPLAMRLMTGRGFPLPVVGLVHTWIEVGGHRAVRPGEALELTVYAEELTPHRRGTEVTMVTEARVGGELVWESRSGYLSRHATKAGAGAEENGEAEAAGKSEERSPDPALPAGAECSTPALPAGTECSPLALPAVAEWRLPAGLGRRYGAVSGDRNPIHLHPLTARLFGFPRAIAHGMWTVARCLAEADGQGGGIRTVRAEFEAPVLLPATVTYAADPAGEAFALRSGSGRVHLTGVVTRGF
ncbi:MaoC/PaaZ C-terminal domain-containing protein [Streptomyces sp. NPDC007346]|uniref:MaoC/PaaZ C-terminal domain-containing protein n=1 Tax=Streptomyces sp. NPDC007346 TaxID=3154682 RepID=UPI0034568860